MEETAAVKTETGYLEEAPGQKSFTRVAVMWILIVGLLMCAALLFAGIFNYLKSDSHTTLMDISLAVAALFGATVIPAGAWKVVQKSQEDKTT